MRLRGIKPVFSFGKFKELINENVEIFLFQCPIYLIRP